MSCFTLGAAGIRISCSKAISNGPGFRRLHIVKEGRAGELPGQTNGNENRNQPWTVRVVLAEGPCRKEKNLRQVGRTHERNNTGYKNPRDRLDREGRPHR